MLSSIKSFFFAAALLTAIPMTFAADLAQPMVNDNLETAFFGRVTLPAGTLVFLETTQRIDSRSVTIGNIVRFRVMTDVIVEGKTVVKSGTQALGRVTSIEPGTYNEPEILQVEVKYVQAVDGQQVNLSTNPIDIRAEFTGEAATINVGTTATSHVMNDIEIRI